MRYCITYISSLSLLLICSLCSGKRVDFDSQQTLSNQGKFSSLSQYNLRMAFPLENLKIDPKWIVVAGRNVFPGAIYRVLVEALRASYHHHSAALTFNVSLTSDDQAVNSGTASCEVGQLNSIALQVPPSSIQRKWELIILVTERDTGIFVSKNSTALEFRSEFLTILIQTSRPVYNAGQKVMFRVVLLDTELKPYEDPVFIAVLDPVGHMMRRWPSRHGGNGVINLNLYIPNYPLIGNWTILVKSGEQVRNQTFLVEQYFKPRFEVFVRLKPSFKLTDEYIIGVVVANMTNWRYVQGNCSIKLQLAANNDVPVPTRFKDIAEEYFPRFTGVQPFKLPVPKNTSLQLQEEAVLRVYAAVGDSFGWQIQNGWALTRLIQDGIKLMFVDNLPLFFRPGMPFSIRIFVSHVDNHPLNLEELMTASLEITFESQQMDFWGFQTHSGMDPLTKKGETRNVSSKVVCASLFSAPILDDQPLLIGPGGLTGCLYHAADGVFRGSHQGETCRLRVYRVATSLAKTQMVVLINGTSLVREEGIATATFTPPVDADIVDIRARMTTAEGLVDGISGKALKHHSPRERHIQVHTSTHHGVPGENIVFHVRNDFYLTHFNFAVTSKGVILYADRMEVADSNVPSITTFSFPASGDMAPVANMLVWAVDKNGEIIAHSVTVPVNPLARHEISVRWNEHKDHTGGSAEVKMLGEKGAFFAAASLWEETFLMDAGHDLTEARIIHQMLGLLDSTEFHYRSSAPNIGLVTTRSRYGRGPKVKIFSTSNTGPDVPSTFDNSALILITDAQVYYHPSKSSDATPCEIPKLQCLTGGCYRAEQRCDGNFDCADYSDEKRCRPDVDPRRQFRLHRISRIHRFYDPEFGDWGWKDIRQEGREISVFTFPKRPQHWVFSVFAVGTKKGLGIMRENIMFDSAGPFVLIAEAPPVARMWEQVAISVAVFNHHRSTVGVSITLPHSPDYQSIFVERNGVVDYYNPRKSSEKRQHVVWIPAASSLNVPIPIVFTRMGKIDVTVHGVTQIQKDSHTVTIEVIPEGATISKHTSVLLDLKSRALTFEFFNIHLDESPIIPYKLERRYIYGTPRGHISITGDVVGPAFPSIPVGADSLLGSAVMGAETCAYNLAANMWTLHYLRLTTEQDISDVAYKVLKAINVDYAALSRYQNPDGGFVNWIGSESSVWLTAHAIKCLWLVNFPDWENFIYADPAIIHKAVTWILHYQTPRGAYSEPPYYINPLNSKMDPRAPYSWRLEYGNVSLTAYVVIAFSEVMTALDGDLHRRALEAQRKAVSYLEENVDIVDDPYDLALLTWALMKSNSGKENVANVKLHAMKRHYGNLVYWSREPIGFNTIVYEDNQRPYMQPKDDQKWDAHAVEATAYALLVYLKRPDLSVIQESIVRFLASMRELDGGLISSLDSLVAMEALVQYSNIARIREVTKMKVFIEPSSNKDSNIEVYLNESSHLSAIRSFELQDIFGHINIIGRGSGQALVQLDYSFGVDREAGLDVPPIQSFDFHLRATYDGRNNSYVNITSCMKWINTEETETSGATVVDIHLPSGYYVMQDELIAMASARTIKNLRWALRTDKSVLFFFNRIEAEMTCFSYKVERWYPVANHSRYNLAIIYEQYQPERFKMSLFEVFPLYTLDICEVCGSFQCPYCPYHSVGPNASLDLSLMLGCLKGLLLFGLIFNYTNQMNSNV